MKIKENKLLIITLFAYTFVFIYKKEVFDTSTTNFLSYIKEMVLILPPIFILSSLINIWVPSKKIEKYLGKDSKMKGKIFSFLIGSFSAGPIYAAFPIAKSLFDKGATIGNIVIIISSWAVIKVPMFIVESKYLGLKFSILRYVFTVVGIVILSYISHIYIKREEVEGVEDETTLINNKLPQLNCKSCGYKSCYSFAQGVKAGEVSISDCLITKKNDN